MYKNLQIIKAFNNIEEEALSEKINNNKLREIEIYRLISNNKEGLGIDFEEENDLSLLLQQGRADQLLGIVEQ